MTTKTPEPRNPQIGGPGDMPPSHTSTVNWQFFVGYGALVLCLGLGAWAHKSGFSLGVGLSVVGIAATLAAMWRAGWFKATDYAAEERARRAQDKGHTPKR